MGKEAQEEDEEAVLLEYHGQYMTHVAEKKARGRHKELMRQMGAIVISGSEDQLTEEEEWIQQHARGPILMPSTSRLTTVVQMIPLSSDVCVPRLLSPGAVATLPLLFGVSMPKGERV